jgi:hypothetical protein
MYFSYAGGFFRPQHIQNFQLPISGFQMIGHRSDFIENYEETRN